MVTIVVAAELARAVLGRATLSEGGSHVSTVDSLPHEETLNDIYPGEE